MEQVFKSPITQHETKYDPHINETKNGRAWFMQEAKIYMTEGNRGTFNGRPVFTLYSIFFMIGKSKVYVYRFDGKPLKSYHFADFLDSWDIHDLIMQSSDHASMFSQLDI